MMANRLIDLMFMRRGLKRDDYLDMERTVDGELAGMDEAVAALHDVHEKADSKHTIVVAPDFDMDGIMAGSLLTAGLAELGFPVEIFVPNSSAGYGMNAAEADRLLAEHPNAAWVITCDMGIMAREGIKHLVSRGIEVIITDHHTEMQQGSARSLAVASIDPCGIGESYALPEICGATVAWRLLNAYACTYASREVQDRIYRLRAFAGIGTVSDLMPLVHDNRMLVRDSLSLMRLVWANPTPWFANMVSGSPAYSNIFKGLSCALSAFNEEYPFETTSKIDEKFIGFSFAPTFNSAKRLGIDIGHAFNVFLGDDDSRVVGMGALMQANAERKRLVKEAMHTIEESTHPYLPVCVITDAPAGVLGLIAARIETQGEWPTVVVRRNLDGSLSGSGRSPEWYPFIERTKPFGVRALGHQHAFGISFPNEAALAEQVKLINADAQAVYAEVPKDTSISAGVDFVIGNDDRADVNFDVPLLLEFISLANDYRPFGRGWAEPTVRVLMSNRQFNARAMGSEQQHLSVTGLNGFRCVCWNEGHLADDLSGHDISLTGALTVNEFAGNVSVELIGSVDR